MPKKNDNPGKSNPAFEKLRELLGLEQKGSINKQSQRLLEGDETADPFAKAEDSQRDKDAGRDRLRREYDREEERTRKERRKKEFGM